MLTQLFVNGIVNGSLIALLAVGFGLVYNTTKIFHIAYAMQYALAAYVFYAFSIVLGMNVFIAVTLSIIFTIFLSMMIEAIIYMPLIQRQASHNQILVSSLGIMIIGINLIALIFGNDTKVITTGSSGIFNFGTLVLSGNQLKQFLVCMVLLIGFACFTKFSQFGLVVRALRDDSNLSAIFAINHKVVRLLLFGISGLIVSIGSMLIAIDVGMDPYVGMPILLNAFVAVIIGGSGKLLTPIIGGFMLGIVQALSITFVSANWSLSLTFIVLIIFLLLRPQGIAGELAREV